MKYDKTGSVRALLAMLSGIALWMMWRAWNVTPPELESIRMRYSIAEALFGSQSTAGQSYSTESDWRGLLPLVVLSGVVFSALKPLPRFIALMMFLLVGAAVGIYFFHEVRLIVPLGGPAIMLVASYICG